MRCRKSIRIVSSSTAPSIRATAKPDSTIWTSCSRHMASRASNSILQNKEGREREGLKLSAPGAEKFVERCGKLGIKNIHVHKGPTILPLNLDAFDVADIDDAATNFQNLNFIVEHCGLPRLDDFCWIATQETNVYGGLAVVLPFIHSRPEYFAHVISELL